MKARADEPLRPPPAGLDLANAVPYDGRDAVRSYVVSTADRRQLRLSESALFLLRAASDGCPISNVAGSVAGEGGAPPDHAAIRQSYEALIEKIEATLRQAPRNRAGMWLRIPLVPEGLVHHVANLLTPLFSKRCVVVTVPVAVAAISAIFWRGVGALHGTDVVVAYGIFVAILLSHESGHAAAAARGGAPPRHIGFVMYLVWPAFYSDVTDSWRLTRRQRLVVDIGGGYIQLLATAVVSVAYDISGWQPLAVAVAFSCSGCLINLNPFMRFDGYWLLGDALGVDDLRLRSRAALATVLRGPMRRRMRPDVKILAVYALLAWAVWGVFAVWILVGAYQRVGALPLLVREVFGKTAPASLYAHLGLSLIALVAMVFVIFRAGRLTVSALASGRRRLQMRGARA